MKIAPRRSIVVIIFGLFLAASLLLVYSSSDSAQATNNWNPTYSMKLCNGLSSVFIDASLQGNVNCANAIPATSAARTITINNSLATGDLNFSSVTYFEDNDVGITPGCNVDRFDVGDTNNGILNGRDTSPGDGVGNGIACLRPGDKVGGLRNLVSLGVLNGPCTAFGLTVDFVLYNVALPDNINDPRASTNIYTPGVEGTGSSTRFSTAGGQSPGAGYVDVVLTNGNPGTDNLADVDINDPLNAAVSSQALTNYPDWLLDIFDPDWLPTATPIEGPADPANSNGSGNSTGAGDTRQNSVDGPKKPLIPLAVYGGISNVAGSKTPLYFVQFDDGVLGSDNVDGFQPPNPFSRAQATLGQPYTTILTDTTPIILGTSPISDFCTGLLTTIMIKGTTVSDSVTRATNPASDGSHPGLVWSATQRDLDNDDLEQQLDTCPKDVNTDTFPRVGTDPDGDMVDAACDLDVGNAGCNFGVDPVGVDLEGGDDCDGDGWQNALDNCPLDDNVLQTQSELLAAYSATAPDGGPKSDGIGDACESGGWTGIQNPEFSGTSSGSNTPTTLNDTTKVFTLDPGPVVGKLIEITGGTGEGQTRTITSATATELTISTGGTDWTITPDTTSTYILGGTTSVTLSSTVSNGHYHVYASLLPICYGASTDADGDGWCSSTAGEDDSTALLTPKITDFAGTGVGDDTDHDPDDSNPLIENGNAWMETFLGLDESKPCAAVTTKDYPPTRTHSWNSDFDDNGTTDIFDVNILKPAFFKDAFNDPGPANGINYRKRVDLDGNGRVDIFDVNILKPNFFKSCNSPTPYQQ